MEFDIRSISLVEGVAADARIDIEAVISRRFEFNGASKYSAILPARAELFESVEDPERTLTALRGWTRIYRYPDGEHEAVHIVASSENADGTPAFYRVDMRQPPSPKRGLRPSVELVGGAVMSHDECATWLTDLAHSWLLNPDQSRSQFTTMRPIPIRLNPIRLAWVGPEVISGLHMPRRLAAVGKVFGAEIIHVAPRSFRGAQTRLASALPLHAAFICRNYAPFVTEAAVPHQVPDDLVYCCDSQEPNLIEQQVRTWIDISRQEIEKQRREGGADEEQLLLAVMLRGMLAHSKIGQYNHCQKQTVLTGVRGCRLNVAASERIIDENSEEYAATKDSEKIFLWKAHNDGRQYFLNPQRIEHIKTLVISPVP